MTTPQHTVLVTGGTGLIAGHCILQLLDAGYTVRATVRSRDREAGARAVLESAGMVSGDRLTFVVADLTDDAGWAEAMAGCDGALHVASPVVPGRVADEDVVVSTARDGAVRVLRAARDAGVRRVVLTSAFHAVGFGHGRVDRVFTEADWSVLDGPGMDAYGRSKTLAERAAWEFVRDQLSAPELTTLCPVAVMGPVLGADVSGANHLVLASLRGDMPAFPHVFLPIVDVRDVAAAHVLALSSREAAGERFILSSGAAVELRDVGRVLRAGLGGEADRVPTRTVPNVVVRATSLLDKDLRHVVPDLGHAKRVSSDKARRLLGWEARPADEAILAAGRSVVDRGLVAG